MESLRQRGHSSQWRQRREDLRVNNKDDIPRAVTIEVRDGGERQHRATYELAPGQSGSALTVLSDGEYRVTVMVGSDRHESGPIRVSDRPDEVISIEIHDSEVTIDGNSS